MKFTLSMSQLFKEPLELASPFGDTLSDASPLLGHTLPQPAQPVGSAIAEVKAFGMDFNTMVPKLFANAMMVDAPPDYKIDYPAHMWRILPIPPMTGLEYQPPVGFIPLDHPIPANNQGYGKIIAQTGPGLYSPCFNDSMNLLNSATTNFEFMNDELEPSTGIVDDTEAPIVATTDIEFSLTPDTNTIDHEGLSSIKEILGPIQYLDVANLLGSDLDTMSDTNTVNLEGSSSIKDILGPVQYLDLANLLGFDLDTMSDTNTIDPEGLSSTEGILVPVSRLNIVDILGFDLDMMSDTNTIIDQDLMSDTDTLFDLDTMSDTDTVNLEGSSSIKDILGPVQYLDLANLLGFDLDTMSDTNTIDPEGLSSTGGILAPVPRLNIVDILGFDLDMMSDTNTIIDQDLMSDTDTLFDLDMMSDTGSIDLNDLSLIERFLEPAEILRSEDFNLDSGHLTPIEGILGLVPRFTMPTIASPIQCNLVMTQIPTVATTIPAQPATAPVSSTEAHGTKRARENDNDDVDKAEPVKKTRTVYKFDCGFILPHDFKFTMDHPLFPCLPIKEQYEIEGLKPLCEIDPRYGNLSDSAKLSLTDLRRQRKFVRSVMQRQARTEAEAGEERKPKPDIVSAEHAQIAIAELASLHAQILPSRSVSPPPNYRPNMRPSPGESHDWDILEDGTILC